MSRPNSRRNLDIAIERLAKDSDEAVRIRRTMANAIVGQLLPDGAVKGGSSLKLRFGDGATRFSRDLDTARASDIENYVAKLEDALLPGWNGFTGKLGPGKPAKPKGVPTRYVMQPFEVKLSYNGKSWITVPLEVGHNEIGDAEDPRHAGTRGRIKAVRRTRVSSFGSDAVHEARSPGGLKAPCADRGKLGSCT